METGISKPDVCSAAAWFAAALVLCLGTGAHGLVLADSWKLTPHAPSGFFPCIDSHAHPEGTHLTQAWQRLTPGTIAGAIPVWLALFGGRAHPPTPFVASGNSTWRRHVLTFDTLVLLLAMHAPKHRALPMTFVLGGAALAGLPLVLAYSHRSCDRLDRPAAHLVLSPWRAEGKVERPLGRGGS